MGDIIVYCNIAFSAAAIFFLAAKIVIALKAGIKQFRNEEGGFCKLLLKIGMIPFQQAGMGVEDRLQRKKAPSSPDIAVEDEKSSRVRIWPDQSVETERKMSAPPSKNVFQAPLLSPSSSLANISSSLKESQRCPRKGFSIAYDEANSLELGDDTMSRSPDM